SQRVGPAVFFELGVGAAAGEQAAVGEVGALVGFDAGDLRRVVRPGRLLPVAPHLPAVGHVVGDFDIHDAGAFPEPTPPRGRVQAPEVLAPHGAEVVGDVVVDLARQARAGDADRAARLDEVGQVVQVQVVGAVVRVRIDAGDGVEEFTGEREG